MKIKGYSKYFNEFILKNIKNMSVDELVMVAANGPVESLLKKMAKENFRKYTKLGKL